MLTDDLLDVEIEESVPEGAKRDGWAGIRHAIFSKWEVRNGKDE